MNVVATDMNFSYSPITSDVRELSWDEIDTVSGASVFGFFKAAGKAARIGATFGGAGVLAAVGTVAIIAAVDYLADGELDLF